ncbi:hypothetical protein IE81DRAFT_368257 [Ceraceosorus guamensis]|uniref:Uncharacterized protein n=1 Tax=Ceraceosorus guamensis TaxID=1522189 RepID=A0A316VU97_9BASI|nr:hypothetical protein IE81DRAFT_368257 [Ceraceosorus guamensis]PWN40468.1 hypothetical protein IE81DRAFT_368257 [Ceraceosorus guamensis]
MRLQAHIHILYACASLSALTFAHAQLPCFLTDANEDCLRSLGGIPPSLSPAWIAFQTSTPTLPPFWVPNNSSTSCADLSASAPDPYHRSGQRDPAQQRLEFCENVELLSDELQGWALVTCDQNRNQWNTLLGPLANSTSRGAMWLIDYSSGQGAGSAQIIPFDAYPDSGDFKPLGSSTLRLAPNQFRTFVVNAAGARSFIEVFDVSLRSSGWRAKHVRSISHPLATHTPNSIVALSAQEFLVTQDHFFAYHAPPQDQLQSTIEMLYPASKGVIAAAAAATFRTAIATNTLPMLETVLAPALTWANSSASPTDLVGARIVIRDIIYSNGIALSPRGSTLAVASGQSPAVLFFDAKRGAEWYDRKLLKEKARVYLPMTVDNIMWSPAQSSSVPSDATSPVKMDNSVITAAGHPSGLALINAAKDPRNDAVNKAGSWAVQVSYLGSNTDADREADVDGGAPLTVSKRGVQKNQNGFGVRTLYQGAGTVKQNNGGLQGLKTSTTAVWDRQRKTMLVTGLYGIPGLMTCRNFAL